MVFGTLHVDLNKSKRHNFNTNFLILKNTCYNEFFNAAYDKVLFYFFKVYKLNDQP